MKTLKKLLIIVFAAVLLAMPVSSAIPGVGGIQTVEAAKMSYKKVTLCKGQTKTLKVNGTKKKVKWSSSNKNVVTVSKKGKIKAKKKGTATITAKVRKKKYTCKVKVEAPSLNMKTATLTVGNSVKLKLKGTSRKITWNTSNSAIVTVNNAGKVTAKASGSATVSAVVGGKAFKCKVTVKRGKNNTMISATSISLGATINDSITATDDLHYYKFNMSAAGKLTMNMTSYMQYYCIKIYNSAGTELWDTEDNEWNSGLGYRKDTYEVYLEQGNYYIQVNGYKWGTSYQSTGKYTLNTVFANSNVTNHEPDNSFNTANIISASGDSVTGQISEGDDYDDYAFTLSASGRITLNVTSYMKYYCIKVFDSTGTEIWYTDGNEYTSSLGYRSDTHILDLERGAYFLQVNGYQSGTHPGAASRSTGQYIFKMTFANANVTNREPDNAFNSSTLLAFGIENRGQIAINDEYDNYKVVLSTAKSLTINFTSYMKYYCVKVFDSSGKEIWYTDNNEWNENVEFRTDSHSVGTLSAGTYYIQVNGYQSGTHPGAASKSTGNYKFTVR